MALTAREKREAREQALRDEGAAQARAEMHGKDADIRGPVSREIADLNLASATNPGAVPDAHGRKAIPQSSGAKVTVACKLGVAYYNLQLCNMVTKFQQDMRGGRDVIEAERSGPVVQLRGTAYPRGTPPKGFPAPPEIIGGAALTRGVDKDWFDEWLKQNRLNPIVINKMIFAAETDDAVRSQAAELAEFLSGLDPIDPKKDSRMPKSSRPGEVLEVEPGQR